MARWLISWVALCQLTSCQAIGIKNQHRAVINIDGQSGRGPIFPRKCLCASTKALTPHVFFYTWHLWTLRVCDKRRKWMRVERKTGEFGGTLACQSRMNCIGHPASSKFLACGVSTDARRLASRPELEGRGRQLPSQMPVSTHSRPSKRTHSSPCHMLTGWKFAAWNNPMR